MTQHVEAALASGLPSEQDLSFLQYQPRHHRSLLHTSLFFCPFFALTLLYLIYGSFIFPVRLLSGALSGASLSSVDCSTISSIQQCAISAYHSTGLPWLSTAPPLPLEEFVERRDRVAEALRKAGVDALVVEPGFWFQWLANISQAEWESWEPEERPFLMIVQPANAIPSTSFPSPTRAATNVAVQPSDIEASSHTAFLVPSFEAARARLLHMPFPTQPSFITYEEHWNPYMTLLNSSMFQLINDIGRAPSIIVGDEMRDFISRSLSQVGFSVHGMVGTEIEKMRMRKTAREVGILRAVNTGTVEAVRAVRKCLEPGLSEGDVRQVLDETLRAGGLTPFFDIVLFDENASNPHGGTNGSKILEAETFILIDVGAHLYGYSSDICRTFFPPFLPRPNRKIPLDSRVQKKMKIWDLVTRAQDSSISALRQANATAASIDLAARDTISAAGHGEAFTHRVGHGIGIKAHEPPYLHQGNRDTEIEEGMVMTLEPGVYLKDFGVRTEDVVMVVGGEGEDLIVEVLSGQRASGPWDP